MRRLEYISRNLHIDREHHIQDQGTPDRKIYNILLRFTGIIVNYKIHSYREVETIKIHNEKIYSKLKKLKEQKSIAGFIVISTCNRYEIYIELQDIDHIEIAKELAKHIYEISGVKPLILKGRSIAKHLLKILLGLESPALLEYEIVEQVNKALTQYEDDLSERLKDLFKDLVNKSIEIRKKLNLESSTGFHILALELAYRVIDKDPKMWRVAIIGTGIMARKIVEMLKHIGCRNIAIYSRSVERSRKVARELDIVYGDLEDLRKTIDSIDVIFASSSCLSGPLIKFDDRDLHKTIVIDISIPRCVDTPKSGHNNYYWIDSLKRLTSGNDLDIIDLEKIDREIDSKVTDIEIELASKELIRRIRKIYADSLENIRSRQIAKAREVFKLSTKDLEILDLVTRSIYNKCIGEIVDILEKEVPKYFNHIKTTLGDQYG